MNKAKSYKISTHRIYNVFDAGEAQQSKSFWTEVWKGKSNFSDKFSADTIKLEQNGFLLRTNFLIKNLQLMAAIKEIKKNL